MVWFVDGVEVDYGFDGPDVSFKGFFSCSWRVSYCDGVFAVLVVVFEKIGVYIG